MRDAFDPADARSSRQSGVSKRCRYFRIRTAVQKEFHQDNISGLRGSYERSRTFLEKPLHREDGSCQSAVTFWYAFEYASIHLRAVVEKQPDEFHMIHIRFRNGIITAFDVPIVGGEIKRSPSMIVRQTDVCAAIDE